MNRHLQPLYNDACDVGFNVKFATGQVVTFAMSAVLKDGEGEITGWEYRASHGNTTLVFND